MSAIRLAVAVALIFGTSLCATDAHAQGRGPSVKEIRERGAVDPAVARAAALAGLDTWLRRLVGRFRITDVNGIVAKQGLRDCIGIGAGPGVHCLLGPGPGEQKYQGAPTMVLYGVDVNALKVSYLQVNSESIAEGALGRLSGDTVTFNGVCPIPPHVPSVPSPNGQHEPIILSCSLKVHIYAPAGGKYVMMETDKEMRELISSPFSGVRTVVVPSTLRMRFEHVK